MEYSYFPSELALAVVHLGRSQPRPEPASSTPAPQQKESILPAINQGLVFLLAICKSRSKFRFVEVRPAEVRLEEVRFAEVWLFYAWISPTPFIPRFYALLEQSKVLGIGHLSCLDNKGMPLSIDKVGGYLQKVADSPDCPRLQDHRAASGFI